MVNHNIILFIIFCGLFSPAFAQKGAIEGRVIRADGEAVPFANLLIEHTNQGTAADASGRFVLEEISPGEVNILVSAIGYRTLKKSVEVVTDETTKVDLEIIEDVFGVEEVVISGTRNKVDRQEAPVIVNVLNAKLLKATQSIAISEGLNFQPGVRVETNCQNCGFTQVRLNGLEGAYSQILINNRAVFSALNSVYGLDQIPSSIVERVEVVRGGGSALYGSNAIAGTINIITKDPVENSWELGSYFSLIDGDAIDRMFNFNNSIVSEDLSSGVTLYGTYRNRDSYDANGDGFTELVEIRDNIFGAKAFFKPNDRSKLTVDFSAIEEYRRGGDRLDLAPHFTDITEELTHNTIFSGLTYDLWSKELKDKTSIYVSAQLTDRSSFYGGLGGGRTAADSSLAINAYGTTDDLALVLGTQHTHYFEKDILTVGLENQRYSTQDDIIGYNRLVDQSVNTVGFFGQYEWKPNWRIRALFGARYDYTVVDGTYQLGNLSRGSDNEFRVLSPRVSFMYKINPDFQIRTGYARGFRAPQAFNEDLHISSVGGEAQFVILSNSLTKETSNAYTASINYSSVIGKKQFNFLVEGFYTQLQDPFVQVSTGATLANGSIVEEVRNGEGAIVSGANFEASYAPSEKLSFQMGGTAQTAIYDETQVLFEPENGSSAEETVVEVDEFVRTPNFYSYFNASWKANKSFTLDLTGTYTGSMIVPRVVSESGFLALNESDAFVDANLKASYLFQLKKDLNLELGGGVKNLLNSFQDDFDTGPTRDSDYVYGPAAPRTIFISLRLGNF